MRWRIPSSRRVRSTFAAAAMALLVTGCGSDQPWKLRDVSGLLPDLQFELTRAADGQRVTEKAFEGKVRVVFFGYTSCPDICPTTLTEFSQALDSMDGGAEDVRVLFVSVDPKRDPRKKLSRYVDSFGEQFVGLRASEPVLRDLVKRYRVTFGYDEPNASGWYNVSHSSAAFIFDREGNIRLLARQDDSIEALTTDLQRLVREG